MLCSRIPDEDDDLEANQIKEEEETTFKKGTKRKRAQQHECDVCEKVFRYSSLLAIHMRTHTKKRNRMNAMCARSALLNLVV